MSSEAIEALLGPPKGDRDIEAARGRVKAAGEAVDRMLTLDAFGAQQPLDRHGEGLIGSEVQTHF